MSAGASVLESMRRIAASEGIPLDCVDVLALSPARVARLLDVGRKTIERELEDGNLRTTWIRGARRVAVLDLVEYLGEHRAVGPRAQTDTEVTQLVESFRHDG